MSLTLWILTAIYGVLVVLYCFQKKTEFHQNRKVFFKTLCSLGFLTIGIFCGFEAGFQKNLLWSAGILCALLFSAVGDLLLALQQGEAGKKNFDAFTLGGMAFFAAHVVFSVFFVLFNGFYIFPVVISLVLAGLQCVVLVRTKKGFSLFGVFSVIYLAALGFMASNGLLFFTRLPSDSHSLFFVNTAVGALLFLCSDLLLCYRLFFHKKAFWTDVVKTLTYFGAQLCLAFTLLFV